MRELVRSLVLELRCRKVAQVHCITPISRLSSEAAVRTVATHNAPQYSRMHATTSTAASAILTYVRPIQLGGVVVRSTFTSHGQRIVCMHVNGS
jgi:hypothetical protein